MCHSTSELRLTSHNPGELLVIHILVNVPKDACMKRERVPGDQNSLICIYILVKKWDKREYEIRLKEEDGMMIKIQEKDKCDSYIAHGPF